MSGFFATAGGQQQMSLTIPQCEQCGLYRTCLTPRMEPTGCGEKRILVVAEAPGRSEDEQGVQLIGRAGGRFRRMLQGLGCDLDIDCWKTNSVICRPPGNETPTDRQIEYCRPNLMKTVKQLQPRVIILLGGVAIKSLLGVSWQKDIGSVGRWVGWTIPSQRWGVWICPTYHPSYLEREKGSDTEKVLDLWTRKHLQAAIELPELEEAAPIESGIRLLENSQAAAAILERYLESGGWLAFDYETNMLKPDGANAEIVSCSVCWDGRETIAFPWYGEAVEVMGRLLRSKLPKIAANLKFEERWTRRQFGHGVRNWRWDTMQAAHVLDNRRGISGLKFQAFVRLGIDPYDAEISPFLGSSETRKPNRIREVSVRKLLLYNALDSAIEYRLAMLQMQDMGVESTDSSIRL